MMFPAAALSNVAPVVDSLTVSTSAVAPGGVVFLQVDGHDPDCPDICDSSAGCGEYIRADLGHWSADGGAFENTDDGVSGSPFTSTTDWRAPMTEGLYTITAILSDSGGFMCDGRLTTSQDIQILVTLNPNQPPVIESLTADPVLLYSGETSDLTCIAGDPDDDPLIYEWSAGSGTVTPGADGTAVFTADMPGAVPLTCTVIDPSGAPASDTVNISVIGAEAEKWLDRSLIQPLRVAVDSTGSLFVVDDSAGGIVVLNLFSGTMLYRIPVDGVAGIDVDWNDNLLVGLETGAQVWNRSGDPILILEAAPGDIVDVAADYANRRYGVLDRRSGKVTVYDELGMEVVSFGSNGDGADQCRTPHGLAATPAGGYWPDTHWVVADTGHGMIKVYNGAGVLTSSFGASGAGVGEFINLVDVAVGPDDVIYGSDSFQSWIQAFNPDGTVRETLGEYGAGLGQFMTPAGIAVAAGYDRLVGTSANSGRLQIYVTSADPVDQGPSSLPVIDPSLTFPEQEVSTSSNPLTATLRNDGAAPFGITGTAIDGDFTKTSDCGEFLDPLQSCTFDIVFTPTVAGEHFGELRVDITDDNDPLRVALSGTGVQSQIIVLAPVSLYFDNQAVGSISSAQEVTVTNQGPGPVVIHNILVTAPYLQTNSCPASLAEGSICIIAVRFAPQTVADSFPGTLTVESSALGTPHTVGLDGRSVQIGIDLMDASANEGDVDAVQAVFQVVLNSPGDGAITVDYATSDDTALAGQDYEETSGTLRFGAGEDRGVISVAILPDTVLEPDEERFTVTLSNPVGAVIGDGSAVGTILDNEVCAGPNLLRNPGAEQTAATAGIPGWTEITGFDWHPAGEPPLPREGEAYFFAGQTGSAELEQIVDLSAFADLILAGGQEFEFEGYVQSGDELPADGIRIVVEYLHAETGMVLDSYDSGEIADAGGWIRLHDIREAPVDTGWIRVRLLATRYSGESNDGYADGLVMRSHRAAVLVVEDSTGYEGGPGTTTDLPFLVRLSCTYGEEVSLDFSTVAGTATEDLDYAYTAGTADIPAGSTGSDVAVTVYGDYEDEAHETFFLNLGDQLPPEVVLQDGSGLGTITNDDFCSKTPSYWSSHDWLWPVYSLAVGGVQYDRQGIADLLSYRGDDVAHEVAREQAAVKLNLAQGSPPDILPIVQEADEFLTMYPPGSDPQGDARVWGVRILDDLASYNKRNCRFLPWPKKGPFHELPFTESRQYE